MMRPLLLLPAALLCLAAAPAPKAPAKPIDVFDARDPRGLMGILDAAGATAQTGERQDDSVLVAVTSTIASFSMQFVGCEAGRACKAVLMDAPIEGAPTLAQVNAFNQTSATCRITQLRAGGAHVLYSALLFASTTRADASTHLAVWQGCLADARDFARDPVRYLSEAP